MFKTISTFKVRVRRIFNENNKITVIDHFDWLISVAFKYALDLTNDQKLNIHQCEISDDITNVITSETTKMGDILGDMEVVLMSCKTYTLRLDEKIQKNIEKIEQRIDGLPDLVTNEERQMIHAAMSTSFATGDTAQGHWYKCPNDHISCITECGGLWKKPSCPECRAVIGGENHRHATGITVATEIYETRNLMFQTVL